MATISLQEKDDLPVWQGDQPLSEVLNKLSENPFGPFHTMSPDGVRGWQAYNRAKAEKLVRGKGGTAVFKIEKPFEAEATVSTNEAINSVILQTANKNLDAVGREQLFQYVRELAQTLPNFSRGEIRVQNKLNDFYEDHDLLWIPECFGDFVHWYHLISPQAYQPYLSREEMLTIPALQVQEVGPEGWIELVMYEQPLGVPAPRSVERIIEITNYINSRRHDLATARPAAVSMAS